MIHRGIWRHYNHLRQMQLDSYDFRVKKLHWDGPGWYYVTKYQQRCPRNCCDDSVIEMTKAYTRTNEIVDTIKDLALELKEARRKSQNTTTESL